MPTPIGEILGSLEPGTAHGSACPVGRELWAQLVGPRIADRTEPIRLEADGTLVVRVMDSVWSQELSLLACPITLKLRELGFGASRLRFQVGDVEGVRRQGTWVEHRRVSPPVDIPDAVQKALDEVENAELRGWIGRVVAASVAEASITRRRVRARRERKT